MNTVNYFFNLSKIRFLLACINMSKRGQASVHNSIVRRIPREFVIFSIWCVAVCDKLSIILDGLYIGNVIRLFGGTTYMVQSFISFVLWYIPSLLTQILRA